MSALAVVPDGYSIAALEALAASDVRLAEIHVRCACGHDRGDHLHEAPHACDDPSCICASFRRSRARKRRDVGSEP